MNKMLASAVSTVALLSAASTAQAQERWPRWYLDLHAGMAFSHDIDADTASISSTVGLENGYTVGAALGYLPPAKSGVLSNMRAEVEANYRSQDLDTITVAGVQTAGSKNMGAVSYMFNVYADIPTQYGFKPYVGAGLGWASVSLDTGSGLGNTSDSDDVFAWQLMAGVAYAPTSVPMTEFTLGYRYFAANEATFATGVASNVSLDYDAHNLEAGVKLKF